MYNKQKEWKEDKLNKKSMQKKYRDGKEIFMKKNDKFITIKEKVEDPSTFVSLKIKTKGKRGKGFR